MNEIDREETAIKKILDSNLIFTYLLLQMWLGLGIFSSSPEEFKLICIHQLFICSLANVRLKEWQCNCPRSTLRLLHSMLYSNDARTHLGCFKNLKPEIVKLKIKLFLQPWEKKALPPKSTERNWLLCLNLKSVISSLCLISPLLQTSSSPLSLTARWNCLHCAFDSEALIFTCWGLQATKLCLPIISLFSFVTFHRAFNTVLRSHAENHYVTWPKSHYNSNTL